MHFLLLFLVPALVSAFDSSFNYGCQNGKCTFQLVVPKEVAQYIDENALSNEISSISNSIGNLNNTISTFSDQGATEFTELFNGNYTIVNTQATSLNTSVNAVVQNATDLLTASANSNATAHLLYDSIDCFQKNNASSYTCFSLPTTVAPPTTQGASTTGNPSTGDVSTVTGGSTGAPISTLPFTGSTNAPFTGSTNSPSTGASVSTNAPVSGASSPSTSSGSSSGTDAPSSTPEITSTGKIST
uniref:Flo11 domain-containing protein n=1 Tax=Caenorhabditis tropicalis TaxID=1561998 RepID=A0A1I7UFT8_9PELO